MNKKLKFSLNEFKKKLAWSSKFGWNNDSKYFKYRGSYISSVPELNPNLNLLYNNFHNQVIKFVEVPVKNSYWLNEIKSFVRWSEDSHILPSDKNLGLCVITFLEYNKLCFEFLNNNCKMVELKVNDVKFIVLSLLSHCKSKLHGDVYESLFNSENNTAKLASFYILPKVHKVPVSGRPIVGAHSCPGAFVSKWCSEMLSPLVQRLPTYVKNSGQLLNILSNRSFPQDCIFLTFDVVSMYPNMKLDKTLRELDVLFEYIYTYKDNYPSWYDCVKEIIRFLFLNIYFMFDNITYQQVSGIAMGTSCAPNIANFYLLSQELSLVFRNDIFLFKRFIDDGFVVCKNKETAESILLLLKTSGLEFTHKISSDSAIFLDLEIYKNNVFANTGLLSFKTYHKAMNKFLYLPAFSAHHPSTIKSWIYAEILRLRNTNQLLDDFQVAFKFFIKMLSLRGYSKKIITEALVMLPYPLLGPFSHKYNYSCADLPRNDGNLLLQPPPNVFRTPFTPGVFIPFKEILYDEDHLQEMIQEVEREAEVSNPNPSASHHRLILANVVGMSLQRIISNELNKKYSKNQKWTK